MLAKGLYRIVIDCDVAGKKQEDVVRRVAASLKRNELGRAARRVHLYHIVEYETAKCYICGKTRKKEEMLHCGKDVYRCREHKPSTIVKKRT